MEFITYKELNNDILKNLHKIPKDIDVVVGVPRSGLMLASIIALYLNKPLSDIDSFINGTMLEVGKTKNVKGIKKEYKELNKILIVEDSILSGNSIIETKEKLKKVNYNFEYYYLAAYVVEEKKDLVDIYFKQIDPPRVFEWNYLHHNQLINACVDIDGVLCEDPTKEENDDGERYIEFIKNAKPKLIPTRKIGHIVTSRLEKYRKETEYWLMKNNIEYGELHMLDLPTAEERQKLCNHAEFKSSIYKKIKNATWFIESEKNQAEKIYELTNKTVFCIQNQEVYDENDCVKSYRNKKKNIKSKIKKITPKFIIKLYRKINGKSV